MSQIFGDCLQSITFGSCSEKRASISAWSCISECWRFMSLIFWEVPSMVCAASEKQKRGIIMSLFIIMDNKSLLKFNLIKYQINPPQNALQPIRAWLLMSFKLGYSSRGYQQYFQHIMWYKYVDRVGYDAVRVWRRTNLKFNQDDNGMLKSKHPGWFSEHLFRAARSEGPIRGSFGFLFVAVMNVYLWYSGEQEKVQAPVKAEKKRLEDEKNDKQARDTLWYNRFGVASRPIRSIENFMTFIASEKTLNEAFEYIGYKGTVEAYEDYQAGLDGIASDEDRKMLAYYKQSLKHKSHH